MLAHKNKRRRDRIVSNWLIESNLLNTEMIACIVSVALAMVTFLIQAANPVRASESFIGVFFFPAAIATGKFSEQLYYKPRLVPFVVGPDEKNLAAVPVLRKF